MSDQRSEAGQASGERSAWVGGDNAGFITTGDSTMNVQNFYSVQQVSSLAILVDYSKPHVVEKKNSPRAASNASR